jgi:hypothetical protein
VVCLLLLLNLTQAVGSDPLLEWSSSIGQQLLEVPFGGLQIVLGQSLVS